MSFSTTSEQLIHGKYVAEMYVVRMTNKYRRHSANFNLGKRNGTAFKRLGADYPSGGTTFLSLLCRESVVSANTYSESLVNASSYLQGIHDVPVADVCQQLKTPVN